jgi:hypothetical protein
VYLGCYKGTRLLLLGSGDVVVVVVAAVVTEGDAMIGLAAEEQIYAQGNRAQMDQNM